MDKIFIFIFGTIIGSFLNTVIFRYHTGESIIKTGSRCFSCGKKLKWYELIPIASFAIQRGRCRSCGSKISWQYPIVEIITGLLFLLIFNFQFSIFNKITDYWLLITGYYWLIFSLLIIIAVYDFRHQIIPNKIVYLFDILVLLNLFRISDFGFRISGIGKDFLAGIIFFAFFASLWLVSRGTWMGLGDAKLALGIGWFLGFYKGILALLVSFWLGAIVGIFLLLFLRNRYTIKSRIAFGPFLILGAFVSFFFAETIIKLIL
ncbi:MAG: prepilin peptidase [Candidatus Terrybacteria bacterium]|nr:prepilin peptidase [Candidatus Terrybacteria bacterium]